MNQNLSTIIASLLAVEPEKRAPGGVYLDSEDILENSFYVKNWLKKYTGEDDGLDIVRSLVNTPGIKYRGDELEKYKTAGKEGTYVELDGTKNTRPCRLSRLKETLTAYDNDFVMEGIIDAVNMLNDARNRKKDTKQKVSDLATAIRDYQKLLLSGNDNGIDSETLSTEEEESILEGAKLTDIYWPLSKVHDTLKGIFEKSLNFVAAPQGSYKTKFMVQMAAINLLQGYNVAYISAEMDQREMTGSIYFAMMCDTDFWGSFDNGKWSKSCATARTCGSLKVASQTCSEFYQYILSSFRNPSQDGFGKLLVRDTTGTSDMEGITELLESYDMDMRMRSQRDDYHLDVIFLDYLGILDVPSYVKKKSQDEQGEWRAGFAKKRIAMGFCGRGIPVVSAHQVNREGQKRVDKKDGGDIKSYDLAGSGWIERYADSCVVLRKQKNGLVQIHSVKSRRTGDLEPFTCAFNPLAMWIDENISTVTDNIIHEMGAIKLDM